MQLPPRGRMRIIDEEWIGCTKSRGVSGVRREGRASLGVAADGLRRSLHSNGAASADEHAIAVAVEAVLGGDGVLIGAQDIFLPCERGDQGEQAGLREMEIGEELIGDAERLAGEEENRGLGFSGV